MKMMIQRKHQLRVVCNEAPDSLNPLRKRWTKTRPRACCRGNLCWSRPWSFEWVQARTRTHSDCGDRGYSVAVGTHTCYSSGIGACICISISNCTPLAQLHRHRCHGNSLPQRCLLLHRWAIACAAAPPPPPAASDSFFQVVIPPGGIPTNYAVHEALDFDPNIFFADVPDGEQDEPVLLSSTLTLLDVDTSSSLAADNASSSSQAAVDVASWSAQAAVDVPSLAVQAVVDVPSSSSQAAIDVPSSSAQAAADVASSSTQGAAGNERPIVFDFDLNEPASTNE
uniref:Uncharacterized protein n=1 Tax=Oryza meridionalis TaxID=40149 RepID=A0A0E0E426_9ORYZ